MVERTGAVTAAGAVAVLVAALSFLPIVSGLEWWWASVLFCIAAAGVSSVARRVGMPPAAGALVAFATVPLLAIALDGGGQGLLVVLPTTESCAAVLQVLQDAFVQIYTDTVPAGSSPGIVLLIATGAATAVILVDMVAVGLRAPLPAMLIVLALAIVPGKALRTGTNGWLLAAVAAAALLVVAADRRRRGSAPRIPGLAAGGAVALVLALGAQIVLPAPVASDAQGLPVQPIFGSGADPLVRLGDNLRRGPRAPVLSYSSTGKDDVYLRLAVLEDFTGATWLPNERDRVPADAGGNAPPVPGLAATASKGTVTTLVTAADDFAIGPRLPLPYPARRVQGVAGFDWDSRGLTLVRVGPSSPVRSYSVQSVAVDTNAAALRGSASSSPDRDPAALRVPGPVPAILRETADAWTKSATTPYAEARAIQNHLRGGAFLYDENTPVQQGYDGDGLGVIAKFLTVKSGYCVHFASTMAVLARLEGIASRVVVGYQPGERTVDNGQTVYRVTSDDLHAWPELYFGGVGWVRFEPTPGRGAVPDYAPLPPQAGTNTQDPKNRASSLPTATPSLAAGGAAGGGQQNRGDATGAVLRGGGIAAGILALLALPGLARLLVRRVRLRRLRTSGAPDIGWREIVDTGTDLGRPPPKDVSPRATELVLQRELVGAAAAGSALARVRGAYERQ
ncbi:MAG: hypothetical protein QOC59_1279, partial [Microbacteriaceae bacterium]|nr:hypothetical protein [Microbacteriaceae bacterium]